MRIFLWNSLKQICLSILGPKYLQTRTFRVSSGNSAQSQWRTTTSPTSGDSQSLPKNKQVSYKTIQNRFGCPEVTTYLICSHTKPTTPYLRDESASPSPSRGACPEWQKKREKHTRIALQWRPGVNVRRFYRAYSSERGCITLQSGIHTTSLWRNCFTEYIRPTKSSKLDLYC